MAEKRNGCMIAASLTAVLGLVVLFLVLLAMRGCTIKAREKWEEAEARAELAKARVRAEEARMAEIRARTVELDADMLPRLEPHRPGEPLSREAWVMWSMDETATEYSRDEFRNAANGSPVEWELRVEQISTGPDGNPRGVFGLPVALHYENRTVNKTITLRVDFSEQGREGLLAVRRGDWLWVAGRLSVRGDEVAIEEGRIVERGGDPPVER